MRNDTHDLDTEASALLISSSQRMALTERS